MIYDKDKCNKINKHLQEGSTSLQGDTEEFILLRPSDYLTPVQVASIVEFSTTQLLDKNICLQDVTILILDHMKKQQQILLNTKTQQIKQDIKNSSKYEYYDICKKMTMKLRLTHLEKNIQYSTMVDESNLWSNSSTAQKKFPTSKV